MAQRIGLSVNESCPFVKPTFYDAINSNKLGGGGGAAACSIILKFTTPKSSGNTQLRQDPLEAILVIFGRTALIFFV